MISLEPNADSRGPLAAKAASDLNNLLQIIGGTTELLENIWEGTNGSEKYLHMLKTSVDRAAAITAQLVESAGGVSGRIVLPLAMQTTPVGASSAELTPKRVLLVDDEAVALGLFEQILTAAGFEVVTAGSGFAALDLLMRDARRFDAVMLDFAMPFMDGEETFRRMRAVDPHLRIILATGFIHQKVLQAMLAEGLSAYLRKPLPPEELIAAVQAAVSGDNSAAAEPTGTVAA